MNTKSRDYKDYPLDIKSHYMHSITGDVQTGEEWIDDFIDDQGAVDSEGDLLSFDEWNGDTLIEVEFVDSDIRGEAVGRWEEVS